MDLSVQIPVPETAMGLLIGARCTRLEKMADLTGCRKIVVKGARGDSVRALIAYVPGMTEAKAITDLVKELVRAYKKCADRRVKAVLDAYVLVWERKSPPPDDGSEVGSRGSPPKVSKRQQEARGKAQAMIQGPRAAAPHVVSAQRPDIESDVKAIGGYIQDKVEHTVHDASKGEEQWERGRDGNGIAAGGRDSHGQRACGR